MHLWCHALYWDVVLLVQHYILIYTAIIGQEDYCSLSLSVTFTPDEFEKSVQVLIVNDILSEDSETFYGNLRISHSESLARVVTAAATIEILSSDCKSSI